MNWILLIGLGRESGHWCGFDKLMADHCGSENVHSIDIPGNGVFNHLASPLRISEYTDHLIKQIHNLQPPFGVVGLSLGGMVALDWAQRDEAKRISHLVLINTSTGFSPFYKRATIGAAVPAVRNFLTPDPAQREKHVLELVSNLRRDDPELLEEWTRIRQQRPVRRSNILRQLLAAASFRPPPGVPGCLGLLLVSRRDHLVNPDCSSVLQKMWGWKMQIHPTAGHDLPLDDPEWVVRQMQEAGFI